MKTARNHGHRYAWDHLFSQRHFLLRRGVDFFCATASMGQGVYQAAKRLGVLVSVSVVRDSVAVSVVEDVI